MTNNIIDIKSVVSGTEPFDVAAAKLHLAINYTDDDTLIGTLISAARKAIENYCNITIIAKTITLTVDLCEEMELPYGPIGTITSAKIRTGTALDGTPTYETLTPEQFTTDGESYKVFNSARTGRHVIVYTTTAETSEDLILAIKNELAYRYEKRGDEQHLSRSGGSGELSATQTSRVGVCQAAQNLADPYKRMCWL